MNIIQRAICSAGDKAKNRTLNELIKGGLITHEQSVKYNKRKMVADMGSTKLTGDIQRDCRNLIFNLKLEVEGDK